MSNYNPFSLENKTVLVTGASSGIGERTAIECSKMGANTIITARNSERLQNTFNQMESHPANGQIIADLTKVEDIDRMVAEMPALDGVVLNAGVLKTMPVKNINEESMMNVFETNILSSIRFIQRMLKAKKLNANASIVFISSISTFQVKKGNSLYSATKGAINSFAKVLAVEVAARGIRVNCIQPGFIRTHVLDAGAVTEEQLQEHFKKYPLGIGSPEDIAFPAIYLLSDAAKWVTGGVFTIDGGGTLQ